MATLIPPLADIVRLPQPPTEGELALLRFLARDLGPEWEVYAQPYLNGTRPDVVALHPTRGAIMFEVKDWHLQHYSWGKGQTRWTVHGSHSQGTVADPFAQVEGCREAILRYLVPQVGAQVREGGWGALSTIRVGVYFHNATEQEVRDFLARGGGKNPAVHVLGKDSLRAGAAESWQSRRHVDCDFARLMRAWLNPPMHAREQAAPLRLTAPQERLASTESRFVSVQGTAGSGKSLVLAERASRLALAGKRVLMVSYNITLWHLLRDGVSRAGRGAALQNVTFWHFHGLTKVLAKRAGLDWTDYGKDPAKVLRAAATMLGERFDAVLVDEGQDLQDDWGAALMSLLKPDGQMMVMADDRQNLYGRTGAWHRAKPFGRVRQLNTSHRLHDQVLHVANAFAEAHLPGIGLLPVPAQQMLPIGAPELRWHNAPAQSCSRVLPALVNRVQELIDSGVQSTDIALLLPDHCTGLQIVALLEARGFAVNHVFTEQQRDKRKKYAFWMGDARIKACTVHSFKGWEAQHVIALLGGHDHASAEVQAMAAYTAITRAQRSLTVFNTHTPWNHMAQVVAKQAAA